ncbi:hypothetical protein J3F84DRAFT_378547 [Trichoderma pleuroticola]
MSTQSPGDPSTVERRTPFFLSFPQEIFLLLLRFLPIPARISLALTTKCLLSMVFPDSILPRLNEEDLITFLSAFQKDVPDAYLCFCCMKLRRLSSDIHWYGHDHKWTIGFFNYPTWNIKSGSNWHVPAPYYFSSFKDHFYVDFMDAYLVMNYHFLGASHGVPLQTLERYVSFQDHIELHNCRHSTILQDTTTKEKLQHLASDYHLYERKEDEPDRKETAWRISFQMTPKVILDKLYLRRFYTIVGPLEPWNCMARLISSCSPEICNHLKCLADAKITCCSYYGPLVHSVSDTYISILSRLSNRQGDLQPLNCKPESGSCRYCNTDYDISLYQNKERNEWKFRLSTYHCLGPCRSPSDKFWVYLVGSRGRVIDGSQNMAGFYRLEIPCGDVRQKWREGSQIERAALDVC